MIDLNWKIKETRGTSLGDPFAVVTKYEYNETDILISEYVDGVNILSTFDVSHYPLCFIEKEYNFSSTDFSSIESLIRSFLIEFKEDGAMEIYGQKQSTLDCELGK
jgi:hypothetical protein